jgi:soluble lytic murein transglycosylase-like protein
MFTTNLTSQLQAVLFHFMNSLGAKASQQGKKPEATWVYPGLDPGVDRSRSGKPWKHGSGSFQDLIVEACEKHQVPANLVRAVIKAESNFNPKAVSRSGAKGLMQLMPATAKNLGVKDPFNPRQNIEGGVRLLRQLLNRYDNQLDLALAAYNAGTVAVDRYQGIPPYRETQIYVPRVKGYMASEQTWMV